MEAQIRSIGRSLDEWLKSRGDIGNSSGNLRRASLSLEQLLTLIGNASGGDTLDIVSLTGLFENIVRRLEAVGQLASTGNVSTSQLPTSGFVLPDQARFIVSADGIATEVVVPASVTTDNTTLEDLIVDLNGAIAQAGLGEMVVAVALDDGDLAIRSTVNSALTTLGLTTMQIVAADPTAANGQLVAAIDPNTTHRFELNIGRTQSADTGTTVMSSNHSLELTNISTQSGVPFIGDNVNVFDLVEDLNEALTIAGATGVMFVPDLGGDGVDVNPLGISPNRNDRLVLVASDPSVSSLTVSAFGAGLGLGFAPVQQVTAQTNTNAAHVLLALDETPQTRGPDSDSPYQILQQLETIVRQVSQDAGAPLPDSYSIDPMFSDTEDFVSFNLQLNHEFDSPLPFTPFEEGFDLGAFGRIEVSAIADATISALVHLDLDVGWYFGELPVTPIDATTTLASLNAGSGVALSVGITAAGTTPVSGRPAQDTTFTITLKRDAGDETQTLTLPYNGAARPVAIDNTSLDDLAADLNRLFQLTSSSASNLSDVLQADVYRRKNAQGAVLDERLVISSLDPSIRAMRIDGAEDFGFTTAQQSNFSDLRILVSDPSGTQQFLVDLDRRPDGSPVQTVGDVIAAIHDATGNRVQVRPSDDQKGLVVEAWSGGAVDTNAIVSVLPASTSLEEMFDASGDLQVTSSVMSQAIAGLGLHSDHHGSFQIYDPACQMTTGDIPLTDDGTVFAAELNAIFGGTASVTHTNMGQFQITFASNLGDVQQLVVIPGTGGIQGNVQTLVEGVTSTTSEVQQVEFTGLHQIEGAPLHGQTERDRIYIVERDPDSVEKNVSIRFGLEVDDVDLAAALGQLSFEIQGDNDAKVAAGLPASAPDINLGITVGTNFKDPGTQAADGRIFLSEPFDLQSQVLVLNPLDPTVTSVTFDGGAYLALGVDKVTTADDFLESITGVDNPLIRLSLTRTLNATTGEPEFSWSVDTNFQNLVSELKDFDIDDILQLVRGLVAQLQDAETMQFMTRPLPLVNKSLNDIVDFTDGLVAAADRVLSAIDEDALGPAIGVVESAVWDLGLPLEDKRRMQRSVEVLNRLKPLYTDAQLLDEDGNPTDWRERLPGRLLSAVRNLAKAIQFEVLDTAAADRADGWQALVAARDDLIALVPQLNSVGERVASFLEEQLRMRLPSGTLVAVDIGPIRDMDSSQSGDQRAITLGIKLRNDNWFRGSDGQVREFQIDIPPDFLEFPALDLQLNTAAKLYVGGEIVVGAAAALTDNQSILVLADNPLRQPVIRIQFGSGEQTTFENQLASGQVPTKLTTIYSGLTNSATIELEKGLFDAGGTLIEGDRWLIRDQVGTSSETHYALERRDGGFEVRTRPIGEVHLHRTGMNVNVGFDAAANGSVSIDGLGEVLTVGGGVSLLRSEYVEANGPVTNPIGLPSDPIAKTDSRFVHVAVTYTPSGGGPAATDVLRGGENEEYAIVKNASHNYELDLSAWLVAHSGATISRVAISYQTATLPGAGNDRAAQVENRAAARVFADDPTVTNDIGAVGLSAFLGSLTVDLHNRDTSGLPCDGSLLVGSLDLDFAGKLVENAVTVAATLEHLDQPRFYVDRSSLARLIGDIDFDLKALIRAARLFLDKLETGIAEGTIQKLPLVGNIDRAGLFIQTLRDRLLDPVEMFVMTNEAVPAVMEQLLETEIFNQLGPSSGLKVYPNPDIRGTGILDDFDQNGSVTQDDVTVLISQDQFAIQLRIRSFDELTVAFDTGLEQLPITAEGGVNVNLEYTYDLGIGYSKSSGFYLITNSNSDPELTLQLEAGLGVNRTDPAAPIPTTLEAQIGNTQLSITDILQPVTSDTGTFLTGEITLNIKPPLNGVDGDVVYVRDVKAKPLGQIVTLGIDHVQGELNLRLEAGLGTNLPMVQSEVFASFSARATTSGTGEITIQPDIDQLEFANVGVRLGALLNKQVGRVIDFVDKFLAPLKPVVKILKEDVPGLSQLSEAAGRGRVTFLDLALTQAEDPEQARNIRRFVNTVDVLITLVDTMKTLEEEQLVILVKQLNLIPVAVAAPDGTATTIDKLLAGHQTGLENQAQAELEKVHGPLGSLLDKLNEIGVHLDLIESPVNLIKLLVGSTFNVVSWDLPRFELPFSLEKSFRPVPPIPPLVVRIGFDFNVFAQLSVGLDSRGLQTGQFLDGFHFRDLDRTGNDIAEFGLLLAARLAALLDVGVASAGIEGELRGTLDANWHDPNLDGKLYLDEIRQILATEGVSCLFDIHGELRALVRVIWEVLGQQGSKDFIDALLFEFNTVCPQYELGHVVDGSFNRLIDDQGDSDPSNDIYQATGLNAPQIPGTLVLHAGAYAGLRRPGISNDVSETFEVEQMAPGVFEVRALGLINQYSGVEEIYFNGGLEEDQLQLVNVDVPLTILAGPGDEVLVGTRHADYLDGGAGKDLVIGRGGGDILNGGSQDDVIWGDFAAHRHRSRG